MRPVFFVKDEEADKARRIESKLLKLPLSTGVLFVGVSVHAGETDSEPIYKVWVGIHKELDERLVESVVRSALRDEIHDGMIIRVEAHRGISRSPLQKVVD